MGHANPAITARTYWHITAAGAMRDAIREHSPLMDLLE